MKKLVKKGYLKHSEDGKTLELTPDGLILYNQLINEFAAQVLTHPKINVGKAKPEYIAELLQIFHDTFGSNIKALIYLYRNKDKYVQIIEFELMDEDESKMVN